MSLGQPKQCSKIHKQKSTKKDHAIIYEFMISSDYMSLPHSWTFKEQGSE